MAGKAKTVRVTATRNLDLMNEGEVNTIDRDEHVERLIEAGYLVEVDEAGQPLDKDVDLGVQAQPATDGGEAAAPTSGRARSR
jgi:hypothetical protein